MGLTLAPQMLTAVHPLIMPGKGRPKGEALLGVGSGLRLKG